MFRSTLSLRLNHRSGFELFLNPIPKVLLDNSKLWDRLYQPRFAVVGPNTNSPAQWLYDLTRPVVNQFADVKPIAQSAVTALLAANDCRPFPESAAWPRDAFGIQTFGDRAYGLARGVFAENAPNDICLIGIDLPQTPDEAPAIIDAICSSIAMGKPRRRTSLGYPAALCPFDIVSEFFPLLLVEQPLYRALESVDLTIAQSEKPRPPVVQPFPNVMCVALITRNAARRVSKHLIDVPSFHARDQGIHARPLTFRCSGRATDRRITEYVDDSPTLSCHAFHANADLVINRPAVLELAAIPCVY